MPTYPCGSLCVIPGGFGPEPGIMLVPSLSCCRRASRCRRMTVRARLTRPRWISSRTDRFVRASRRVPAGGGAEGGGAGRPSSPLASSVGASGAGSGVGRAVRWDSLCGEDPGTPASAPVPAILVCRARPDSPALARARRSGAVELAAAAPCEESSMLPVSSLSSLPPPSSRPSLDAGFAPSCPSPSLAGGEGGAPGGGSCGGGGGHPS